MTTTIKDWQERRAEKARAWAGETAELVIAWLEDADRYGDNAPLPYTDWAAESAKDAAHWGRIALEPWR